MKQETLEEMAYRELGIKEGQWHPNIDKVPYFIKGYKLAQQQNKNLYSEEEIIDIFFLGRDTLDKALITKDEALILIEQFKKK